MRITIDIPDDLMQEALKVTKSRTKTEAVKKALLNIVQINKIKSLKAYKGKIDLDVNLNRVRGRSEYFSG